MLVQILGVALELVTILLFLALALLIVFGVAKWIYSDLRLLWHFARSRSWQPIEGRVESATVMKKQIFGRMSSRWVKSPTVKYSYRVDDGKYHGERRVFDFGGDYPDKEAETIVARYPKGATVEVFYDPRNPASSTLERSCRGIWSDLQKLPLALVAAFVMGLSSVFAVLRMLALLKLTG